MGDQQAPMRLVKTLAVLLFVVVVTNAKSSLPDEDVVQEFSQALVQEIKPETSLVQVQAKCHMRNCARIRNAKLRDHCKTNNRACHAHHDCSRSWRKCHDECDFHKQGHHCYSICKAQKSKCDLNANLKSVKARFKAHHGRFAKAKDKGDHEGGVTHDGEVSTDGRSDPRSDPASNPACTACPRYMPGHEVQCVLLQQGRSRHCTAMPPHCWDHLQDKRSRITYFNP